MVDILIEQEWPQGTRTGINMIKGALPQLLSGGQSMAGLLDGITQCYYCVDHLQEAMPQRPNRTKVIEASPTSDFDRSHDQYLALADTYRARIRRTTTTPESSRGDSSLLLSFLSRRPIGNRRRLPQGSERLLHCQQDRRLEGAECTSGTDGNRVGRHRAIVRSLVQRVSVMLPEGVPELQVHS